MKLTVFFMFFTIAFLSTVKSEALPLTNIEDIDFLRESTGERLAGNSLDSGPGVSKIIMVADADLLRKLKALERNMPERILSPEGRDESPDLIPHISIIRRDTKRCMVGRVYRPCWQV